MLFATDRNGSGRADRRRRRLLPIAAAAGTLLLSGGVGARPGFAAPPIAPASKPQPQAAATTQTSYYGVYLQSAKVGSLVMTRTPAQRDGAPAIRYDTVMTLDMRVLGAPAKVTNRTLSFSDARTGRPLFLDYRTQAAGLPAGGDTRVIATYRPDAVTYQADVQGSKKNGTLSLKAGESFLAEAGQGGAELKPRPGLVLKGKVFSPDTLTLLDSEMRVIGQEPVALGGQTVPGWRVIDKNTIATTTMWLSGAGDLLRQDAVMGIQIRREPKDIALAAPAANSKVDIAQATGITPTGETLKNPRALTRAEYEITGLTKPLPLQSNSVQTITQELDSNQAGPTGALRARVAVTARPLPTGPAASLFAPGQSVPDNLQPYLRSTLYVPADDPAFRELARKVVGGETDAARAAQKIADYVHKTITPDPSIAALRTAGAILRTPRGVCRDYTTLFAAIARAAGLPTKQCVGVGYADGRFFYHAWPEVWVGSKNGADEWIALEPTWGMPFADATHIKLAEGEITDVFNLAQDLGKYQIKVLRAE